MVLSFIESIPRTSISVRRRSGRFRIIAGSKVRAPFPISWKKLEAARSDHPAGSLAGRSISRRCEEAGRAIGHPASALWLPSRQVMPAGLRGHARPRKRSGFIPTTLGISNPEARLRRAGVRATAWSTRASSPATSSCWSKKEAQSPVTSWPRSSTAKVHAQAAGQGRPSNVYLKAENILYPNSPSGTRNWTSRVWL